MSGASRGSRCSLSALMRDYRSCWVDVWVSPTRSEGGAAFVRRLAEGLGVAAGDGSAGSAARERVVDFGSGRIEGRPRCQGTTTRSG